MAKAKRNRETRRKAYEIAVATGASKQARSIARALRRHGRMPLPKRAEQR